jgi:hypothetical protein
MTEWDKECAFWDDPARPETFDFRADYDGGDMIKQKPGAVTHGEWIRADDYRAEVERLQAKVDHWMACCMACCMESDELGSGFQERVKELEATVSRVRAVTQGLKPGALKSSLGEALDNTLLGLPANPRLTLDECMDQIKKLARANGYWSHVKLEVR